MTTLLRLVFFRFFFLMLRPPPRSPLFPYTRSSDLLPQMYADTYGVHNIEFQHSHIVSTEASYLKELRARIEKTKSRMRSEEHTSELQSLRHLVCRLLLVKKKANLTGDSSDVRELPL